jgi:hypothetical protein
MEETNFKARLVEDGKTTIAFPDQQVRQPLLSVPSDKNPT